MREGFFQVGEWIAITFSTAASKVGTPASLGSCPQWTARLFSSAFSLASLSVTTGYEPSPRLVGFPPTRMRWPQDLETRPDFIRWTRRYRPSPPSPPSP